MTQLRATASFGPRSRDRGVTLIELLVTVVLLAILARLVAPSFEAVFLSNKLAGYANAFLSSAQVARSEAVKRNSQIVMCRSNDGATCASDGNWQQGWLIFADTNKNATVDSGEAIIQTQAALSTDYHLAGDNYSIIFPSGGVGVSSATLTLCRFLPSPGDQERVLQVYSTGRISVTKTTAGSCAG